MPSPLMVMKSLRLAVELAELHSLPDPDSQAYMDVTSDLERSWDQTDLEWLYDQPLYAALVALDT